MAKRKPIASDQRNVVYYAPTVDSIYEYTRAVCKELGETIDPDFDTPDMLSEIANFIKVVAEISTQQLNTRTKTLDTEQS